MVEVKGRPYLINPDAARKLSRLALAEKHRETFGQIEKMDCYLAESDKELVLRIRGNEVVGVVTGQYTSISDLELLEIIENAIMGTNFILHDFQHSIHKSRFTFLDKESKIDVRPGDTVQGGFDIVNSETGMSGLVIYGFIFRMVCSNGLMLVKRGMGFYRMHRGLMPRRILEKFAIALPEVMQSVESNIHNLPQLIKIRPNKGDFEQVKKGLRKHITNKGIEILLEQLPSSPTAYDLLNAVTAYARTKSLSTRSGLERYAGLMLQRFSDEKTNMA